VCTFVAVEVQRYEVQQFSVGVVCASARRAEYKVSSTIAAETKETGPGERFDLMDVGLLAESLAIVSNLVVLSAHRCTAHVNHEIR
jgi:hypothetical protein